MGTLQDIKDKAKDIVTENKERIEEGLEKAAEFADRKTGHKHTDKIDETAHTIGGKLDALTGGDIGANEPATPPPSPPSVSASVPTARDAAVSPDVIPNSSPEAAAEPTRTRPRN